MLVCDSSHNGPCSIIAHNCGMGEQYKKRPIEIFSVGRFDFYIL